MKKAVFEALRWLAVLAVALTVVLSVKSALSLLVFCLLYTPCVATIASIKRELGAKWAVGMVFFQCAVAWVMAALVYLVTLLF